MAAKKTSNKTTTRGKRYSEEEKAEILSFVASQGRGGAVAAAKKYGVSQLTISTWKRAAKGVAPAASAKNDKVDKDVVLRVLAQKGFKVVRLVNALTGDVIEDKIDPKIEKLNLDFAAPGRKASDDATYVTRTDSQVLVTMTLDRLLAITGTKP